MTPFTKVVRLGAVTGYNTFNSSVYCKIKFKEGGKLSITGVVGPTSGGNARGGCGQIVWSLPDETFAEYAPGWDAERVAEFIRVWERWHLNDMVAACPHQKELWGDTQRKVDIYHYRTKRSVPFKGAENAAIAFAMGTGPALTSDQQTIMQYGYGFESPQIIHDERVTDLYEIDKTEQKAIGWLSVKEHPEGLLSRPCPVCGYKYGTAWLKEDIPQEVYDFLFNLPNTDKQPAWV